MSRRGGKSGSSKAKLYFLAYDRAEYCKNLWVRGNKNLAETFGFLGKGNTIQGPAGVRVRLEQSSNLVDWECWTTFLLKAGPIEFYQTGVSSQLRQFYRAVMK